jgi:hypothetical protein
MLYFKVDLVKLEYDRYLVTMCLPVGNPGPEGNGIGAVNISRSFNLNFSIIYITRE